MRILLVEDDARMRALVRRGLLEEGHVVETIETVPGSRTMALDATTHKLYVAAAKPLAGGRGNDPASFHVLVYARK